MKKILVLSLVMVIGQLVGAGSLEPSAAPGPTMKTLDEVEPRIPIHASDLPLKITESGSYYLVEDANCVSTAITVNADDVTIDLMGYKLVGPDTGTNYGVYMDGRSNVEIRNGTIRDFEYGIYEQGQLGENHRVIDVRAISNALSGIYLSGFGHLVKDCTASDNGKSATSDVHGIFVNSGSTVTSNTAHGNGTSAGGNIYGILGGNGSTVTGNTARNNGNSATGTVYGINVRSGSTVIGNTAYYNGSSATGASVYGIFLQGYNLVDQNTAYNNGIGASGSITNMPFGVSGCVYGVNVAPP